MIRRFAAVAAVLLAATLLTSSPATAAAGNPDHHRPQVGDCRDLTPGEAGKAADPDAPVACSTKHTARTIDVARVPGRIAWSDGKALGALAVRVCEAAVQETLGRSERANARSAYRWVWFEPTRAEKAQGARWVRCDLVLLGGHELLTLPTDETPALPPAPLPDGVARCLTRDIYVTACAKPHAWRATGAFELDQRRYPDDPRSSREIQRRCDRLVDTRSYRWTYAGEIAWRLGYRTVVCHAKTSR